MSLHDSNGNIVLNTVVLQPLDACVASDSSSSRTYSEINEGIEMKRFIYRFNLNAMSLLRVSTEYSMILILT